MEAARSAFAEKGYAAATVGEIAARSEFGKGTLYNYFPGGKEELLHVLFQDAGRDLCGLTQLAAGALKMGVPARDALCGYVTLLLSYFEACPETFALLYRTGPLATPDGWGAASTLGLELHERLLETLLPPLQRAQARQALRALTPRAAAALLLGAVWGYLAAECYRPDARPVRVELPKGRAPDEIAPRLAAALFDGLAGAPGEAS